MRCRRMSVFRRRRSGYDVFMCGTMQQKNGCSWGMTRNATTADAAAMAPGDSRWPVLNSHHACDTVVRSCRKWISALGDAESIEHTAWHRPCFFFAPRDFFVFRHGAPCSAQQLRKVRRTAPFVREMIDYPLEVYPKNLLHHFRAVHILMGHVECRLTIFV